MENIVVIGGNGYIGKEIIKQILKKKSQYRVYNVNRSMKENNEEPSISSIALDASDYSKLEENLPQNVDYLINLTYGDFNIIKNVRLFAETHHVRRIGNINSKVKNPAFRDFVTMKNKELAYLLEGQVPVANYDLSIAYGNGRNDNLAKEIEQGAWNEEHPVKVDLVAKLLLNDLFQDWLNATTEGGF